MKYTIVFESSSNYENLCEELASDCHYNCPIGNLSCPFKNSKNCCDITAIDWKNVIKEIKK